MFVCLYSFSIHILYHDICMFFNIYIHYFYFVLSSPLLREWTFRTVFCNHFIALFLNNTILIICFYEIRKLKQIYYPLCVRLKKHTNLFIHTRITSYTLLMLGIQYVFVAALFGLHHTPWHLLFAHTILLLLCVNIIGLQFHHKSNLLYILLPISLNLIEHYLIFN